MVKSSFTNKTINMGDKYLNHHRRNAMSIVAGFIKPIAYLIVLLLTYVMGYLSSRSSTPCISSSTTPTLSLSSPPSSFSSDPSFSTSELFEIPTLPSDIDQFRVKNRCSDPIPHELVRSTILERVFNGTSPFYKFPPPHMSRLLHAKRIKGWGSNGAVFENLIRQVKPRTIIEVGSFLGASATHMVKLTRDLGLDTQILCVDDFRGWPGFLDRFKELSIVNGDVSLLYQFMQNVIAMDASESVLPLPFSTGSVLDSLCSLGIYGDLIEVDAGHDFNSAWSDINRAYRILRPGGVLFGHDYFTAADNRGVRRAVDLFARVNGFKVKPDGQHWVLVTA